jgi:hypothetical protein
LRPSRFARVAICAPRRDAARGNEQAGDKYPSLFDGKPSGSKGSFHFDLSGPGLQQAGGPAAVSLFCLALRLEFLDSIDPENENPTARLRPAVGF